MQHCQKNRKILKLKYLCDELCKISKKYFRFDFFEFTEGWMTEAILRKPTKVSMKVLVQMNPDFWQEIFGTQDWSLAHGGKSGISAGAQPISIEIQKTQTSQENHINSWFCSVFCKEKEVYSTSPCSLYLWCIISTNKIKTLLPDTDFFAR